MQTLEIGIRGMTCGACATRIERALKKARRVTSGRINLAPENAAIEFGEKLGRPADLTAADRRKRSSFPSAA